MSGRLQLLETQLALQAYLLDEPSDIAHAVSKRGGLDVAVRLGIYREAYRARLIAAVREGHGHTVTWLGDERFDELARSFVDATASRQANLRWYAEGFADWLVSRCPDEPVLAELAALDWSLRCAFDGPDAGQLTLADVARVPAEAWSEATLVVQPSAALRVFRFNTLAIWHAIDADSEVPAPHALEGPIDVLIWRRDLQPHFRSLSAFEAAALRLALEGRSFAATCEQLAARYPGADAASEAGALLRRWIGDGVLCGVRQAPTDKDEAEQ